MSEAELAQCADLQQQEWEVLQSIWPDNVSTSSQSGEIKVEVPVELEMSWQVQVHGLSADNAQPPESLQLSYLPSILFSITLPPAYPLGAPPCLVSLHATHSWLSHRQLAEVQQRLLQKWDGAEEGVLYTWLEWVRSGDILRELGILDERDGIIRLTHPVPRVIAPKLAAFNAKLLSDAFASSSFPCTICLTSLKGSRCISLACGHVFCRECLEDFWKLCIREGDVGRVGCPDVACVKKHTEAEEEEVRRVVTEEETQRWKWLRVKRMAEKDPSIIYCPIPNCQAPVPRPPGAEEDESGWARYRACGQCSYTFCALCKKAWHGPLTQCEIFQNAQFVANYMELEDGSPEKLQLERRYGKRNMERLVASYREDKANKEYLSASTTACPGCEIPIQKSQGCNHMTCSKCGQHFCFRCRAKLDPKKPYVHFSTSNSECFGRLFDYRSDGDDDFEML